MNKYFTKEIIKKVGISAGLLVMGLVVIFGAVKLYQEKIVAPNAPQSKPRAETTSCNSLTFSIEEEPAPNQSVETPPSSQENNQQSGFIVPPPPPPPASSGSTPAPTKSPKPSVVPTPTGTPSGPDGRG